MGATGFTGNSRNTLKIMSHDCDKSIPKARSSDDLDGEGNAAGDSACPFLRYRYSRGI
jgi:hypothetical protein